MPRPTNGWVAALVTVLALATGGDATAATPAPAAPAAAADGVTARLKARISVEYPGTPLRRALDDLGRKVGVPLEVDWKSLAAAGIEPTAPVRLSLRDVPAAKVLDLVLHEATTPTAQPGWVEDRGVLLVTIGENLVRMLVTQSYDVARFTPAGEEQQEQLSRVIHLVVDPEVWRENGGSTGAMRFLDRRTLVVTAHRRTHDALRAMFAAMAAPTRLPNLPPGLADSPARRQALDRLARPLAVRQADATLADLVAKLPAFGLNVYVEWRALEAAGVDRQAALTVPPGPGDRALGRALAGLGEGARVGFEVDEDGVVTISTAEALSRRPVLAVYDGRPFGAPDEEKVEQFTKLIMETVAPDTWREAGGSVGAIKAYGPVLVVTQTAENHRAIARWVAETARLRAQR